MLRLATPAVRAHIAWRVRPVAFIQYAVMLLVVTQLGRIPLLSTGDREAPLLFNDLCVLAMIGVAVVRGVSARSFSLDRVALLALLFASVGAFSAVLAIPRFGLSGFQLVVSLAYLARWLVYFGVYLVILNLVSEGSVGAVWASLETAILAFAAFGIFQAIFLPHFAQLVYPDSRVLTDWDEQGHRLVSTVLDPNIAGAMIMLVLLVELAQLSGGERVSSWKPLLLFVALMATLSRSSLLGLLAGVGVILLVRGISKRVMRFGLAIGVVFLLALPKLLEFAREYNKLEIDASALTRITQWLRAIEIFSDHPILGVGFNTYGFVQESYGYVRLGASSYATDGGLLFIAVMTGIVGVALYLGMLGVVMARCRRVWRDPLAPPAWRAFATGVAACTVAICVQSLFVNSLLTTFVMEELWLLWGLAFVVAQACAERAGNGAKRLVVVPAASLATVQ